MRKNDFNSQFHLEYEYYLKKLDFIDWYRYFFIIKEVIGLRPEVLLEIGAGNEIVKNCLRKFIKNYRVMDINAKLNPDILSDIRKFKPELKERFNCIICAEVLEHMPFSDSGINLRNIYGYLTKNGKALITIPHRRSHFLFMTPTQKPYVFTVPTGFLSPGAFYRRFIKRKIWIDPHHCWEIGDGKVKRRDVELLFRKVGFRVEKFKKLLYVDFWVLSKD